MLDLPSYNSESRPVRHEYLELESIRRTSIELDTRNLNPLGSNLNPVGGPAMDVIRNHEHTDNVASEAQEESSILLSRDDEVQDRRARELSLVWIPRRLIEILRLFPDFRTLLLKLGTSFFLFGLINNGMLLFNFLFNSLSSLCLNNKYVQCCMLSFSQLLLTSCHPQPQRGSLLSVTSSPH